MLTLLMHGSGFLRSFFQQSGKISAERAEEICFVFDEIELQKNELLLKEGKVSNEYLILEKGFMRSFSVDPEGNEITTAFFDGRLPVFEVASFFMRLPSQENIEALTPCTGWIITYDKLNQLFHDLPEFREFGRSVLVKCFAAYKIRTLSMITETAEERYASLLASSPQIFQHAPLKYIASYLGITDSSLSRIRKELSKK